MRNIIALLAITVLVGCNTAYQRPNSANAVSVRFVALQHKGWYSAVAFYAHNGGKCTDSKKMKQLGGMLAIGGTDLSDAEQGMLKDPKISYTSGQYFETAISSDTRFFFTVSGGEARKECFVTSSFIPMHGAQYEVSYVTDFEKCHVRIDLIVKEGDKFLRIPDSTVQQRENACSFFWN